MNRALGYLCAHRPIVKGVEKALHDDGKASQGGRDALKGGGRH